MITEQDDKDIAAQAALLPEKPLTNRAFLLGASYICHAIYSLRIEHSQNSAFTDEILDTFDELMTHLTKEFTIDEGKKIDPEFNRGQME